MPKSDRQQRFQATHYIGAALADMHGVNQPRMIATSASTRRFYSTLAAKEDATQEEIHQAFKWACRWFHPDVQGGELHPFYLEVMHAYQVLGNEENRRIFDETDLDPTDKETGDQVECYALIREITNDWITEQTGVANHRSIDVIAFIQKNLRSSINLAQNEIAELKAEIRGAQQHKDSIELYWRGIRPVQYTIIGGIVAAMTELLKKVSKTEESLQRFQATLKIVSLCRVDRPAPKDEYAGFRSAESFISEYKGFRP